MVFYWVLGVADIGHLAPGCLSEVPIMTLGGTVERKSALGDKMRPDIASTRRESVGCSKRRAEEQESSADDGSDTESDVPRNEDKSMPPPKSGEPDLDKG